MSKFAKFWFQPYTPIIFVLFVIFNVYFVLYPAFQHAVKTKEEANALSIGPSPTPTIAPQKIILDQLGKLMVLPTDETPEIVTITDVGRFKDQPFLSKAKNGDVLIVYSKSRKAILFDPKNNRIIDTAPINIASDSAHQNVAPIPTARPTAIPTQASATSQPSPTQRPPEPTPTTAPPTPTTEQPTPTATPTDTPTPTPL